MYHLQGCIDQESLAEAQHGMIRVLESRPAVPYDMSVLREKDDGVDRLGFYVIFCLSLVMIVRSKSLPKIPVHKDFRLRVTTCFETHLLL